MIHSYGDEPHLKRCGFYVSFQRRFFPEVLGRMERFRYAKREDPKRISARQRTILLAVLLSHAASALASAGEISGIVTSGQAYLSGARVRVKATQILTTTDDRGRFILHATVESKHRYRFCQCQRVVHRTYVDDIAHLQVLPECPHARFEGKIGEVLTQAVPSADSESLA